jgi:hypothetical protein
LPEQLALVSLIYLFQFRIDLNNTNALWRNNDRFKL